MSPPPTACKMRKRNQTRRVPTRARTSRTTRLKSATPSMKMRRRPNASASHPANGHRHRISEHVARDDPLHRVDIAAERRDEIRKRHVRDARVEWAEEVADHHGADDHPRIADARKRPVRENSCRRSGSGSSTRAIGGSSGAKRHLLPIASARAGAARSTRHRARVRRPLGGCGFEIPLELGYARAKCFRIGARVLRRASRAWPNRSGAHPFSHRDCARYLSAFAIVRSESPRACMRPTRPMISRSSAL